MKKRKAKSKRKAKAKTLYEIFKPASADVCKCGHRRDHHGVQRGNDAPRCLACKSCMAFRK